MARDMVTRDLAVTVTNTSLALAGAIVVADRRARDPAAAVPALTVFLAYRAYMMERQRHERLEFLYEATRTLVALAEIVLALEGAAGALARGVPRRDGGDRPVQLRRQPAAAHHARPRRLQGGDGADGPTAIAEELRALVDAERPAVRARARRSAAERLRRYLDGAAS